MKRKMKRWQLILIILLLMLAGVYAASTGVTMTSEYDASAHKHLLMFIATLLSLSGTTVFVMSFIFLIRKLGGQYYKHTRKVRKDVRKRETL